MNIWETLKLGFNSATHNLTGETNVLCFKVENYSHREKSCQLIRKE